MRSLFYPQTRIQRYEEPVVGCDSGRQQCYWIAPYRMYTALFLNGSRAYILRPRRALYGERFTNARHKLFEVRDTLREIYERSSRDVAEVAKNENGFIIDIPLHLCGKPRQDF